MNTLFPGCKLINEENPKIITKKQIFLEIGGSVFCYYADINIVDSYLVILQYSSLKIINYRGYLYQTQRRPRIKLLYSGISSRV